MNQRGGKHENEHQEQRPGQIFSRKAGGLNQAVFYRRNGEIEIPLPYWKRRTKEWRSVPRYGETTRLSFTRKGAVPP